MCLIIMLLDSDISQDYSPYSAEACVILGPVHPHLLACCRSTSTTVTIVVISWQTLCSFWHVMLKYQFQPNEFMCYIALLH